LKKAAELPKPPALPKKWIERNWQELSAEFSVASQTPNQIDPAVLEREQQKWKESGSRNGKSRLTRQKGD
jgi:hypothetical protein